MIFNKNVDAILEKKLQRDILQGCMNNLGKRLESGEEKTK